MNLSGEVTGSSQVVERIRSITPGVRTALEKMIQRLVINLRRHVVQDKLQGQVLKVKTGRLQRSVEQTVVDTLDGATITGIVSTNVVYAAIQEYGGTIHMPARLAKLYRSVDKFGDFKNGGQFAKKSRANFVTEHQAKAYDIHMPERSYLRAALNDMRSEITDGIEKAVSQGLKK